MSHERINIIALILTATVCSIFKIKPWLVPRLDC